MTLRFDNLPNLDIIGRWPPGTTKEQLQNNYRRVRGSAALQYFLDLAIVDPDSFCRFYVLMTWRGATGPRLPNDIEMRQQINRVKLNYARHLERMRDLLVIAAKGPPHIVAFLREQAEIEYIEIIH